MSERCPNGSPPPRVGGVFGVLDRFCAGCWLDGHEWVKRGVWWVCVECGKRKK